MPRWSRIFPCFTKCSSLPFPSSTPSFPFVACSLSKLLSAHHPSPRFSSNALRNEKRFAKNVSAPSLGCLQRPYCLVSRVTTSYTYPDASVTSITFNPPVRPRGYESTHLHLSTNKNSSNLNNSLKHTLT